MDMATIGAKYLRKKGLVPDLDESEEINACSIEAPVTIDGKTETWLIQFKNETHNHPTEIEPFGGAATCLGGAIRDPLSGRSYVYQAMRVTGSGDPTVPFEKTLTASCPAGKSPPAPLRGIPPTATRSVWPPAKSPSCTTPATWPSAWRSARWWAPPPRPMSAGRPLSPGM